MMQTFQFKTPSVIVNGPGAAKEVGSFAKGLGKKALLVTDNHLEKIGFSMKSKTLWRWLEFLLSFITKLSPSPQWIIQRKD
jgi:alcohol dehydrogenase class IV